MTNQNWYETENFLGALLEDAMDFVSTDCLSFGSIIVLLDPAASLASGASLSSVYRRNWV
jgi:hypothetical protein